MNTKRRQSRTIVYKYIEVPQAPPVAPVAEPVSQSPKESLAYRAWANCYQPPTVHFNLPSATSSASPSTSSSRSGSASSSHSSASSTSSHGAISKLSSPKKASTLLVRPLPSAPKPPPLALKTSAYSSPAILTRPPLTRPELIPAIPSPPSKPSNRPVETSYTTTTTTITTKEGIVVKEHKRVSSHGFRKAMGVVDWSVFRSPDWQHSLYKEVSGRKVLAGYSQGQAW